MPVHCNKQCNLKSQESNFSDVRLLKDDVKLTVALDSINIYK